MNKRQAGVLLHPTSLPNQTGMENGSEKDLPGQLNDQAWLFLDWMESAGLKIWQMLPLTQPHDDLSPYQAVSAFALNPALLPHDWEAHFHPVEFALYLAKPPHWLENYALFMTIREQQNHASWSAWPHGLKYRDVETLENFSNEHADKILLLKKQQFVLSSIWYKLKKDANQKGIQLFGDMPIFVAFDSADVWANPQQFKLDKNLDPTVVTGVPPDYFSETGQRWGNPHYNWEVMQADGFSWWRKRVAEALHQFDLVRIDHFRGLDASWEIDAKEETAMNGQWVKTPGDALLEALKQDFPDLPLVAEDLGIITDEVVALKEKYALPGMSVLQFGFNGLPDNPHSLHEQVNHSVTYTGTHDNDTTIGWFESLDEGAKNWVMQQLQPLAEEVVAKAGLDKSLAYTMPWPLVIAGFNSVAERVIVPMQDFLMLDGAHRMNVPGTSEGNWTWQFNWQQLPDNLAQNINALTQQAKR
ncbi:4-alpha-glucanotransferase [Thiomicrorhabdus sp. Milos-T2]|uniref:4-alpha-glucanotransferase n=1 Tax=Thiomicrorhabdus sp. Milos-T2 TaxID=90814 RepID=UPI00068BD486|nr:4-alpha-glucanotransferase [Thiomicrorhabdus sp. Milos-T2]